jgi:hypothetical protein
LVIRRNTRSQPLSDADERLAEKGKSRLGAVQSVGPAAKRGRIGHAIRVFECRRGFFPGAVFHRAPPQCLTAPQHTVMGVRERKQREEGEGLPAPRQRPRRIPIQSWCASCACLRRRPWPTIKSHPQIGHRREMTSAQFAAQSVSSLSGETESGINRIVYRGSAPPASTCQDQSRKQSSFLLNRRIQLEENIASRLWLFRGLIRKLAANNRLTGT